MVNINKCSYSLVDVKEYVSNHTNNYFIGNNIEVVDINSTGFNSGISRDYPFCHAIQHPETGEILKPVRGFMGTSENGNDRCYYAEYVTKNGEVYSYIYQFAIYDKDGVRIVPTKSIDAQQREDVETYKKKFNKTEDPGQMGEN